MAHLIKMADSMTKKDATSPTKIKKKHTPGIVYLSRLPPFMRPAKVRNIFSKHGEVGRIFLQPEGIKCLHLLSCLCSRSKT